MPSPSGTNTPSLRLGLSAHVSHPHALAFGMQLRAWQTAARAARRTDRSQANRKRDQRGGKRSRGSADDDTVSNLIIYDN